MDKFSRRQVVSVIGGGLLMAFAMECAPVIVTQPDALVAANDNHKAHVANDNVKPVPANDNRAAAKAVDIDGEATKALRDYIAQCEGTAGLPGGGYSTSLDYGKWLPGGKEQDLTVLTLDQIDALQTEMLSHPENAARYAGGGSSAIGRYQIVRRTLRSLWKQLHLSGDYLFDAALQDRLALTLAHQRGATRDLGNEWASLTGRKLDKAIELARAAFEPRS
jgi:hypothetical protein